MAGDEKKMIVVGEEGFIGPRITLLDSKSTTTLVPHSSQASQ